MTDKDLPPNPAILLSGFALNQVWGGKYGHGDFRAKITLFGSAPGLVAELYFKDSIESVPVNLDSWNLTFPSSRAQPGGYKGGYFVLYFPMSTLGPILEQLRHSPLPLRLDYYEKEWSIVSEPTESARFPNKPTRTR